MGGCISSPKQPFQQLREEEPIPFLELPISNNNYLKDFQDVEEQVIYLDRSYLERCAQLKGMELKQKLLETKISRSFLGVECENLVQGEESAFSLISIVDEFQEKFKNVKSLSVNLESQTRYSLSAVIIGLALSDWSFSIEILSISKFPVLDPLTARIFNELLKLNKRIRNFSFDLSDQIRIVCIKNCDMDVDVSSCDTYQHNTIYSSIKKDKMFFSQTGYGVTGFPDILDSLHDPENTLSVEFCEFDSFFFNLFRTMTHLKTLRIKVKEISWEDINKLVEIIKATPLLKFCHFNCDCRFEPCPIKRVQTIIQSKRFSIAVLLCAITSIAEIGEFSWLRILPVQYIRRIVECML